MGNGALPPFDAPRDEWVAATPVALLGCGRPSSDFMCPLASAVYGCYRRALRLHLIASTVPRRSITLAGIPHSASSTIRAWSRSRRGRGVTRAADELPLVKVIGAVAPRLGWF